MLDVGCCVGCFGWVDIGWTLDVGYCDVGCWLVLAEHLFLVSFLREDGVVGWC